MPQVARVALAGLPCRVAEALQTAAGREAAAKCCHHASNGTAARLLAETGQSLENGVTDTWAASSSFASHGLAKFCDGLRRPCDGLAQFCDGSATVLRRSCPAQRLGRSLPTRVPNFMGCAGVLAPRRGWGLATLNKLIV